MHREGRDKKQEQGVNILLLVFVQAAAKATLHEGASESFPSEKRGRDCDVPKRGATLFVVYTRLCPMYPSPLFSDPALADFACTVHFVWKTNPLHLGKINLVLPAETLPTCLAAEKAEFNLEVSGKLQELLDAWLSRNLAFTKMASFYSFISDQMTCVYNSTPTVSCKFCQSCHSQHFATKAAQLSMI